MEGLRWFPAAFPSPGFQKLESRNPWRIVLVETENNFLGSVLKENLIFFRRNPPVCVVAPLSQSPGKSLASFDSISAQVLPFLFYNEPNQPDCSTDNLSWSGFDFYLLSGELPPDTAGWPQQPNPPDSGACQHRRTTTPSLRRDFWEVVFTVWLQPT